VSLTRLRDVSETVGERALRRSVGRDGARLSVLRGDEVVGFVEVEPYRRRGVGTALIGEAAAWLRPAAPGAREDEPCTASVAALGFRELTRTARGWPR
jgi:GNAT superfamily N-acetyltransferase